MTIETTELELSKVERVTREYDAEGRVARETMEYWFPKGKVDGEIGFASKRKKICKTN